MLLEAFLTWNSVIYFQCEINRGIRVAPKVGAIMIGQKLIKTADFGGLGMNWEKSSV